MMSARDGTKEAAKENGEFSLTQKGIEKLLTSNYERIIPHTIAIILMYICIPR
jgi:hypothetical protein